MFFDLKDGNTLVSRPKHKKIAKDALDNLAAGMSKEVNLVPLSGAHLQKRIEENSLYLVFDQDVIIASMSFGSAYLKLGSIKGNILVDQVLDLPILKQIYVLSTGWTAASHRKRGISVELRKHAFQKIEKKHLLCIGVSQQSALKAMHRLGCSSIQANNFAFVHAIAVKGTDFIPKDDLRYNTICANCDSWVSDLELARQYNKELKQTLGCSFRDWAKALFVHSNWIF